MSIHDDLPEAVGELTLDQAMRKLGISSGQCEDLKLLHLIERTKISAFRQERLKLASFKGRNLAEAYAEWRAWAEKYRKVPEFGERLSDGLLMLNQLVALMNAYANELEVRDDFYTLRQNQVQTQGTLKEIFNEISSLRDKNNGSQLEGKGNVHAQEQTKDLELNRVKEELEGLKKQLSAGTPVGAVLPWVFYRTTKAGKAVVRRDDIKAQDSIPQRLVDDLNDVNVKFKTHEKVPENAEDKQD